MNSIRDIKRQDDHVFEVLQITWNTRRKNNMCFETMTNRKCDACKETNRVVMIIAMKSSPFNLCMDCITYAMKETKPTKEELSIRLLSFQTRMETLKKQQKDLKQKEMEIKSLLEKTDY